MKTSRVVDLKSIKLIWTIKKNAVLIFMCCAFIVGVGIGVFSNPNLLGLFGKKFLNFFFEHHFDRSFLHILMFTAMLNLLSLLLQFMFGASLIGVALIPSITAFHGFWYGLVSSVLYTDYSLKGVGFNATVLLPPYLFFVVVSIFAARESIGFSLLLAKSTLPRSRPINFYMDFKNYCGRFLVLLIFIMLSAVLDAVLSNVFLQFFNFK